MEKAAKLNDIELGDGVLRVKGFVPQEGRWHKGFRPLGLRI